MAKNDYQHRRDVRDQTFFMVEYDDKFHDAWNAKAKMCDYCQKELDARLKEGLPHYFAPFEQRYPYMKDIRYDKPQKGWTD
jgi:hypothetical protein